MVDMDLLNAAGDNLMIMAALYIVFTVISNFCRSGCNTIAGQILVGIIFGCFAVFSMTVPVYLQEGIIIDSRVPIISMAGIAAGPIGSFFAAIPAILYRLHVGGIGATAGVLSIILAALASGMLGQYIKQHNNGKVQFKWIVLYAFMLAPICLLPMLLLPADIARQLMDHIVVLIGVNFSGALVLGYLLSQDTNRRIIMNELDSLKQKAEEAATAKSVFMARMSHELRTPMNSIIGFTDLLRSTQVNDEQRYFLDQIKTSGKTMTALVSDILDFSRMEIGSVKLNPAPINLVKMVESCGALMDVEAHNKGLDLFIEIDPKCPEWIEGDELRLRQILLNLLNNAIKFTISGYITLKATVDKIDHEQCEIIFHVIDTGVGIPKEKQENVFNAFEQVDEYLTREAGGSGLGLSIANHLTQLMSGRISIESAPGQGSTFRVTIPFKRAQAVNSKDNDFLLSLPENSEEKCILVVEDIAMNRDIAVSMLNKLGYNCSTAHNGKEAIERLSRQHFDMVLMDLQMPVMNGYDATHHIREELGLSNDDLPIIALTAHALPEEIAKCFEAGMDDFLTKPIEFIELTSKVEEWIGGGTDGWDIPQHENASYENVPLLAEAELRSFISFVGNERLYEAFEDFVNDNAARLLIIRASHHDDEMIRTTLHNMKSTSGNLGMKKLSLFSQHLLDQGVARDQAMTEAEIDLMDNIFRESCRTFERYMEHLKEAAA